LVSDGIIDRADPDGNALSITGVVDAVRDAPSSSAAGALSAIEDVIRTRNPDDLLDDATIIVLTPVLTPVEPPPASQIRQDAARR
jgi:hypothetical protein